jgi:hypothetical protein
MLIAIRVCHGWVTVRGVHGRTNHGVSVHGVHKLGRISTLLLLRVHAIVLYVVVHGNTGLSRLLLMLCLR